MKQTKFLFPLLMAIVMMAMSPMNSWAEYDYAECKTTSMRDWISFHDEVVIYAEAGDQLTIWLYDGIGQGGDVYPEEATNVGAEGVSEIDVNYYNDWQNNITFENSGYYKISLSNQYTEYNEEHYDDPEGMGGGTNYYFVGGSATLSIAPVEAPFLPDGVNGSLTFDAQSHDVSNAPSDYTLYRYTVTRDGILEVAASGEGDSYGILMDDKLNALIQDDNSNGNNDFKLALRVKSGETYFIGARAKASGTKLTSYSLTITERDATTTTTHVTDNSSLAAAVALFDVDQHTIILDNDINDCDCLGGITGCGEYTIDLNGHTLQLRNGDIRIEQFATLHILNGTVAYNDGSGIYNSGELTLSGCFIQNTYTGWENAVYNNEGATLHFAGACSISANRNYPVYNGGIITFADGYVMKEDGVQINNFSGSIGSSSNCTLLVVPTNLSTLTIADGTSYNSLMAGAEVAELTYTRTISESQVGKWQALYVPFQMSYSDWSSDFEVATIQNFHEYTDESGIVQDVKLEVRYVKSGTLKANHPYLIRPKTAGEKQIVLNNAVLAEAQNANIVCQSVERRYTFTGIYQPMQGLYTNNYLFLAGGSLSMAASDETELKAQRWYLAIEDLGSQVENAPAQSQAKSIGIFVIEDDAPTGIEDIQVVTTPICAQGSAAIYDLQGRRQQSAVRGVNIVRQADGSFRKIMNK